MDEYRVIRGIMSDAISYARKTGNQIASINLYWEKVDDDELISEPFSLGNQIHGEVIRKKFIKPKLSILFKDMKYK